MQRRKGKKSMRRASSAWVGKLRKQRGLSQRQLARRSGVSERTIWAIEQGSPSRQPTKRKLAKALGVDLSRVALNHIGRKAT